MATVIYTPNMNLPEPVVGVDSGPDYATQINNALTIVDGHNHTPGYGVQVPSAGININSNLSLNGNSLTSVGSFKFSTQATEPTTAATMYEYGVDLYYNDGSGNVIQITKNGNVFASSSGIASGTATAAFSSSTLAVQAAGTYPTGTPANIAGGSILLGNNTSGSSYLTLSPPASVSTYTITLPTLPSAESAMLIDSSGNITASPSLYLAFCPTGVVLPYAGSSAPSGWLFCNGAAVSRTTYSNLFGVIGTTFGVGDGSTTFNIPNTGGVFIRGAGSQVISGTTYSGTLGASQYDQFKSHTHTDSGHAHGANAGNYFFTTSASGGYAVLEGPEPPDNDFQLDGGTATNYANIQNTGGSETNPANISLNYIIKI